MSVPIPPVLSQQAVATVAFFDNRAADYDREYEAPTTAGYALRVRREKALALFDQDGGNVLDVGCGPGPMAHALVNRRCRYWGLDFSDKMLHICRQRFIGDHRMQFANGNASELKFDSGFFDAVLCMGVIDAIPQPDQALREMLRVLKPSGILILSFTNLLSPYSWWKRYVLYPAVSCYRDIRGAQGCRTVSAPDPKTRRLYTKAAAIRLIERHGARLDRVEGYYYNPFPAPFDEWFPRVALGPTRVLEQANWPALAWLAAGWLIKATKIQSS